MSISDKRRAGLSLLISMVAFRSIVAYQHVFDIYNVWYDIYVYLLILPIDGIIAGAYGLWSRDKRLAFSIGFLPPLISLCIYILKQKISDPMFHRGIVISGGSAVSMGLMGYGLAGWKEKGKLYFFIGILWFVLFFMMLIGEG